MKRLLLCLAFAVGLGIAGCTPLPPSPEDLQAKRFEAVPDKAVVYLFRDIPDFIDDGATVVVDDHTQGTTYPGTYFRLELAPGRHRIAGFAGDSGVIEMAVQAGRIYFVQQSVTPLVAGITYSHFRPVDAGYGRQAVLRSELIGGRRPPGRN